MKDPGTVVDPYVVSDWDGELPREGDYFLFDSGTCYEILDVYPRRPGVKRLRTVAVKLEQGEVEFGQPLNEDGSGAVHRLYWLPRPRKRRL